MALTARSDRYRFTFGKQSAEGTVQTTSAHEVSLYDGSIEPENNEQELYAADSQDLPAGYYVESAMWRGDPVISSDPNAVGALWVYHLGADSAAGTTNYTHTITRSDTKPFVTPYLKRPDITGGTDRWDQGKDGFVRAIELSATKGQPVRHTLEMIGKVMTHNVTAPTITNDDRLASSEYLTMIGATLKLDIDATPASTTVRNIESVTIRSEYPDAEFIQTDEVTPRFLNLGLYRVGADVTMVFENFQAYSQTFYGAKTGSDIAQSATVVYGSLDTLFPIGPVADANKSLQVKLPTLRWTASPPRADAGGDAVRVTMTAKVQRPSSGEAITVIAKNQTATH